MMMEVVDMVIRGNPDPTRTQFLFHGPEPRLLYKN